jgi:hypothetical protein
VLSGLTRPRPPGPLPPALQEQETPSASGAAGTAWLSQSAPTSGMAAIESQGLETTSQAEFNNPCLHPNNQLLCGTSSRSMGDGSCLACPSLPARPPARAAHWACHWACHSLSRFAYRQRQVAVAITPEGNGSTQRTCHASVRCWGGLMHCLPYHPVCGVRCAGPDCEPSHWALSTRDFGWAYAIVILVFLVSLVFLEWKPDMLTTAQQSDQQQTICMQGLL